MPNDIARERAAASFPINLMKMFLNGGPSATKYRHPDSIIPKVIAKELAYQFVQRDPILRYDDGHHFDLTQAQMREKTMAQIRRIAEIRKTLNDPGLFKAILVCMAELSDSFAMRIGVHEILFRTALTFFSTDDQKDEFLRQLDDYEMLGSFAMTELGHSSSLRDLETTANFDPTKDEWVLLSPTLTSTKWWIGMVGQSATHTVLIAQTIVHGSNIGLNWFLVPLRDRNGRLLPGVSCGDVGAKAGRSGLDNGWIQLTSVCASDPGTSHFDVCNLVHVREGANYCMSIWGVPQGSVNQQILDYQAQQFNLLPAVAGVYVFKLVEWYPKASPPNSLHLFRHVLEEWNRIQELSSANPEAYMMSLPDIHATSAGLKAVVTWWASDVLELCRRACGGHAYSAYNAISDFIANWGVMTTGGGDNFPMAQQCSRYILYALEKGLQSEECSGSVAYLTNAKLILDLPYGKDNASKGKWTELSTYIQLFRFLVVKKGMHLHEKIKEAKKLKQGDPWNDNMVDLTDLTTYHVYAHSLNIFANYIDNLPENVKTLRTPLQRCGVLYAANLARVHLNDLLQLEYILPNEAANLRESHWLAAFGFPDFILMAPIGRHDGSIYEEYFRVVTRANPVIQAPYWNAEIKPLLSML
ncbi:acyl-Coenzyme A oxidase [Dinochytrium kinnereticum]|nr:acyl-Coenzyme A oxidase [Dinochytrium kinnereticum]